MPDLFVYAFVAAVVLVILFGVLAFAGGMRPRKGGAPGGRRRRGDSNHTDMGTS